MNKAKTKQEVISDKLYYPFRIAILISVIFLFIPALNPVRISGMINKNLSLFTSGISYSSLTAEFGRAIKKEWVMESSLRILYGSALAVCLGIAANVVSGCMSLGNHKLKKLGNLISIIGCVVELVGMVGIYVVYNQLSHTSKPDRVEPMFASGFWPAVIVFAVVLVIALAQILLLAKSKTEQKFEMESKYKLFLMFLPFIALIAVFAYLPLLGWRYAFFDYKAGDLSLIQISEPTRLLSRSDAGECV
ncbi:MAG: sugar ABC transporter permease, partial [Acetatifactor sp.]|nr:sugar ABC transporter permease [Acetatifactor sp.]